MSEEVFMREALIEAQKAYDKDEVPVGAVIVYNGKIIARAHNLVETKQDPTAHAEMLCMAEAASFLGNWRLLHATLYCTLEPCIMCAGAMISSRLPFLVWGAPDVRQGAHGSWVNILDASHPIHRVSCSSGVCAEESSYLMKRFFKEKRRDPCLTKS